MRLQGRQITRDLIISTVNNYEIIESYPTDKYLPSFLVFTRSGSDVLHVLFATDVEGGNVRVVTAYRPDPSEWDAERKKRNAP